MFSFYVSSPPVLPKYGNGILVSEVEALCAQASFSVQKYRQVQHSIINLHLEKAGWMVVCRSHIPMTDIMELEVGRNQFHPLFYLNNIFRKLHYG